jgi:hypothetical protein
MLKVMITYNMREGREQECQEYLVNKLAPGLAKLGLRMSDVWYTVWGSSPQITSGGEIADLETARDIFHSNEWEKLAAGMQDLAADLRVKVVRGRNPELEE